MDLEIYPKVAPLAELFIQDNLGNGAASSFWYDSWLSTGPIIKLIGESGPHHLRVPPNASVSEVCSTVGWNLRSPRSDAEVTLHTHLTVIDLPSLSTIEDEYVWVANVIESREFNSARTWDIIRPRATKKDWSSTVWFKGCVPKQAFNLWTAQLDRLPTRTRLASWGVTQQTSCPVCLFGEETRDHILLYCGYAAELWRCVMARLKQIHTGFTEWAELLSWIRSDTTSAPSLLRKVATHSTIYNIWRQRNNQLDNQILIPASTVFRLIDRDIRNILLGRRSKKNFRPLLAKWLM